MVKQLIFIRHAHRDNTERGLDNGLSAKGKRQAQWLAQFAKSRFSREEWRNLTAEIATSPKKRCVESVTPLAQIFESEVRIRPELEEQKPGESFAQFNERIHLFMNKWLQQGPPLLIACSHGDWVPLATFHLIGTAVEPKKGSWLELEYATGRAKLCWYIPSFKALFAEHD